MACVVLGLGSPARAQEPRGDDPWLGRDKLLHFGVSAGIAFGGYVVGAGLYDCRPERFALGGGLAMGAGIGKELWDLGPGGDPSWRDFAWDVIGTAAGLALAWALDVALSPDTCPRASP